MKKGVNCNRRRVFAKRVLAVVAALVILPTGGGWHLRPDSALADEIEARIAGNPNDVVIIAQLDSARASNRDREYRSAVIALSGVVDGAVYDKLSPFAKYQVDSQYAYANYQLGKITDAWRAYARATNYPEADSSTWNWRFHTARQASQTDDEYETFKLISSRIKQGTFGLIPLDGGNVHQIDHDFGTLPNAAQFEFEQYLEQTGWRSKDPLFSPDVIRFHYAASLLAAGSREKAARIVTQIRFPAVLTVLAADRRFDGLLGTADPATIVTGAATKRLSAFREMAAQNPKWIEVRSAVASELDTLGRPEEALAQINGTLADAARMTPLDRQLYDFDNQYDHALVVKSYLLFELGKFDEAIGLASTFGSGGRVQSPNVGRATLLAKWLVATGRGADALHELNAVNEEDMNLETRGEAAAYRACAASQIGDEHAVVQSIQYLRSHPGYQPSAVLWATLCANDLGAAAEVIMDGMTNARSRAVILQELQIYRPWQAETAFQKTIDIRLEQVRSRPEVMKAINRVGRINRYNISYPGRMY